MDQAMLVIGAQFGAVRVVVTNLGVQSGVGIMRLMFTFEIASKHQSAVGCPLWLSGHVELNRHTGARDYVGSLHPVAQPTVLPAMGSEQSLQLMLDVTDRQLQQVDDGRTAGGVQLWINLSGYVIQEGLHVRVDQAQISYQINQSDWITLLERAGRRRVMLVELEAPDPQTHPDLAEAINYYVQAQRRFAEGEWRLTVESLRQVLASLVGKKADDEESEADVQDSMRAARKESRQTDVAYDPRLELVRQAAKFYCDLGAHPEVAETRRHHAYGALVMVGGLLHTFAQLD